LSGSATAPGRAPEAIALLITEADGIGLVWRGGPSRLTGDADAEAPEYRAAIAERADPDWPAGQIWQGTRLSLHRDSPGIGRGLMISMMNVAAEAEEEFADWYETEHLPRLAGVPGVLVAARYRAGPDHTPAYLAMYQMEDVTISQSAAWLEAARTPWSARMRRFASDYQRYSFTFDDAARG
jgi:hypothetical protein